MDFLDIVPLRLFFCSMLFTVTCTIEFYFPLLVSWDKRFLILSQFINEIKTLAVTYLCRIIILHFTQHFHHIINILVSTATAEKV
jgi:hypothetical protein